MVCRVCPAWRGRVGEAGLDWVKTVENRNERVFLVLPGGVQRGGRVGELWLWCGWELPGEGLAVQLRGCGLECHFGNSRRADGRR